MENKCIQCGCKVKDDFYKLNYEIYCSTQHYFEREEKKTNKAKIKTKKNKQKKR